MGDGGIGNGWRTVKMESDKLNEVTHGEYYNQKPENVRQAGRSAVKWAATVAIMAGAALVIVGTWCLIADYPWISPLYWLLNL